MIPNLVSTLAGLALVYATVLHPSWVEQRYLPFAAFAAVILVMALWARRGDAHPWYSSVNIVLAVALGVLSLLPLATLPSLAFWGGFWVGVLVPTFALWAALYRPKRMAASITSVPEATANAMARPNRTTAGSTVAAGGGVTRVDAVHPR